LENQNSFTSVPFHLQPSAEIDIYWGLKPKRITEYKRNRLVRKVGGGSGDPNVLKNCGINPDEYNGFAFGME
jgi:phenylalanyl-tRNA synthetase alpha chain